ncbi:5-formyltetrahydrofolate cyclo-ligase [Paenibacillus psychroresistens]|uniref:5-formyltetrahydrofolate cyclo-ligase n=1 Tax=Paenibacillus psychroresistens TaxID=1778678 RepID=A0A6B8RTF8_9BACL|nr:5-formyltetrahydrofolate cyclo-ligase [Paenibacillus psychroresistens]QGQ98498.1 5-formyltetrahydrofolate cyclo-ligase [Paenibacillus psychroresistens]
MSSSSSSIIEQKARLRKLISLERSSLENDMRLQKSEIICQRAIEHLQLKWSLELQKNYILYTYIPFRDELNIMPIIEWCWQKGIPVAAPRVQSSLKALNFHYINGVNDLQPQPPWGILEPLADTRIVDYSLYQGYMLIPGLAFDMKRARLGYGGGYYDKFLQSMDERNVRIYKLALAMDLQIVEEVPCEKHDLAVDLIISETRAI